MFEVGEVSAAHHKDFIVMTVDGASTHVSKDLVVQGNIRLLRLPPYAPELNPQENVWDEVRKKRVPQSGVCQPCQRDWPIGRRTTPPGCQHQRITQSDGVAVDS
jgi:hypothetical protein